MSNGIQKVAYVLPQGNPTSKSMNDPSGYLLVGMYGSLGKTFRTHEAAVQYATKHGFTIKANRKAE